MYSHFVVKYPNGNTAVFGFPDSIGNRNQLHFPITKISDRLGNEVRYYYDFQYEHYRIDSITFGRARVDFLYKTHRFEVLEKRRLPEPIEHVFIWWDRLGAPSSVQNPDCDWIVHREPDDNRISESGLLSRISITYNNQPLHHYRLEYGLNGINVYLSTIWLLKNNGNTINDNDEYCYKEFGGFMIRVPCPEPPPIDPAILRNDTAYFAMPVRFRYERRPDAGLFHQTRQSLPVNSSIGVRAVKGVFSESRSYGVVVFPDVDMFRGRTALPTDQIVIKPDLNRPENVFYLPAGDGFTDVLVMSSDNGAGDKIVIINNVIANNCRDVLAFSVYAINQQDELQYLYTRTYNTHFGRRPHLFSENNHLPVYKRFFTGDFSRSGRQQILAVSKLKKYCDDPSELFAEIYDLAIETDNNG